MPKRLDDAQIHATTPDHFDQILDGFYAGKAPGEGDAWKTS